MRRDTLKNRGASELSSDRETESEGCVDSMIVLVCDQMRYESYDAWSRTAQSQMTARIVSDQKLLCLLLFFRPPHCHTKLALNALLLLVLSLSAASHRESSVGVLCCSTSPQL